jgi:hypothetical protein
MLWAMEWVWTAAFVALMAAMYWFGFRVDPHFVSRNGERFLCLGQEVQADWELVGRPRETWVYVLDDGTLVLRQKRFLRKRRGQYRLIGRAPSPPKRKVVFLARSGDGDLGHYIALRLPDRSKIIPRLDALLPPQA